MAEAKSKKKGTTASVAERLEAIYNLQKIDSEIDRIRIIRGELPLEIEDLEDEIAGLETRSSKISEDLKELETEISNRKNSIKDAEAHIAKDKEHQKNVRNNREYESLEKEIEFHTLDIELNEKKIKEAKYQIENKSAKAEEIATRKTDLEAELKIKKAELDTIIAETQKDEEALVKKSDAAKKLIDERLLNAYTKLRTNAINGLAVVKIDRDSCGGCFNRIPPQRILDIHSKRKIIVCEHCGRIVVPFEDEQ